MPPTTSRYVTARAATPSGLSDAELEVVRGLAIAAVARRFKISSLAACVQLDRAVARGGATHLQEFGRDEHGRWIALETTSGPASASAQDGHDGRADDHSAPALGDDRVVVFTVGGHELVRVTRDVLRAMTAAR